MRMPAFDLPRTIFSEYHPGEAVAVLYI